MQFPFPHLQLLPQVQSARGHWVSMALVTSAVETDPHPQVSPHLQVPSSEQVQSAHLGQLKVISVVMFCLLVGYKKRYCRLRIGGKGWNGECRVCPQVLKIIYRGARIFQVLLLKLSIVLIYNCIEVMVGLR